MMDPIRENNIWKKAAKLLAQEAIEKAETEFEALPEVEEEELEREEILEDGIDLEIEDIDSHPDDCKPIKRRRDQGGFQGFQKYQFYLPVRGGGRPRPNRGGGWDPGQRPGHSNVLDVVPQAVGLIPTVSIGDMASSMSKGFSVVKLSEKFDYLHVPRTPTAKTAWVFDEVRFKDFIIRRVTDEAVASFEQTTIDPNDRKALKALARCFGSALKAYLNLYSFFLVGQSDLGFIEDAELKIPKGLWFHGADVKQRARSRLMEEGAALYGTPKEPLDLQDQERTNRLWPIFEKVRKLVSR